MTETRFRRAVRQFVKEYCNGKTDYCSLCRGVETLGYTVIGFNHIYNDADVLTLVTALNLTRQLRCANGFTYADKNYRLVFIHEDLAEAEKRMILAHEAGHIWLEHMLGAAVLGQDVRQEYEANEFAHCLLNGTWKFGSLFRIGGFVAVFSVLVVLIMGYVVIGALYLGNVKHYYATDNGDKYHGAECIQVKDNKSAREVTGKEIIDGGYERCQICLP